MSKSIFCQTTREPRWDETIDIGSPQCESHSHAANDFIDNDSVCFFSEPISGPFVFPVSLTVIECLNKLSCCYISESESHVVLKVCKLLASIYQSSNVLKLFSNMFMYLWCTISDIVFLSPKSHSNGLENFSLTKEEANEMYLDVQDLVLDDKLFSGFKDMVSMLTDVSPAEDQLINKVLFDLIMLIYNAITDAIFLKKSSSLISKVKDGEDYKIDHATNEGLAVIRHLGGWTIHSVIANLNRYILSFSSSRNHQTQEKVNFAVKMRELFYNSLTVSASEIHETTSLKETLQHTDYYNRDALTFITDECYMFFVDLEKSCEKYLQKSFLLETGQEFVAKSITHLSIIYHAVIHP